MPLAKRPPSQIVAEGEPALQTLLTDVASVNAQRRRAAARGLGAHPAAATALSEALSNEADESVREAICTALIRIGTPDVAAGLFPLIGGEDVGLRNAAIEVLKTMPDVVSARIDELLSDGADVRIFGVEILGALAHSGSPARLIRVIEDDAHVNVCAAAVEALAECGDRTAVGPLERLLLRFPDEPFLEFSVRTALSRIADA